MKSTLKIVAGLLSFAMVLTLVVGFAVSQADAQTVSFTRNLTVGSRGADVTDLQTILATGGFLSVSPTGYFGALTKAALGAWQASQGISPAVGYFGPISRAAIGGVAVTPTTPGCPAGALFNSLTGAPCTTGPSMVPGCTAGALFSSTTGQSCAGTPVTPGSTLDNTDGSITAGVSTVVPSTITIKKGETKDLIAEQLTASAGKVAVNRFDVQFSERPWLTFSKFELVDNATGNVIATKNISGAADFTEVTVGTAYLLRFDGLNYVVTPGQSQVLKVRGTLLAASDKVVGQAVTVTLPTNGIRAVNGKGYTETTGPSTALTATVTLTATGSAANVLVRVSPSTDDTRIQTTSTSGQTNDIKLAVYDFKSQNQPSTLNSLTLTIDTSTDYPTAVFKSVRLTDGTNSYYAATIGTTTTFTNMNIPLTLDTWKSLTVRADIADQDEFVSGTIASTTITVVSTTNPVGIDANYNAVTATAGAYSTNQITFLSDAISITGITSTKGTVTSEAGIWVAAYPLLTFTVNNTGNNPIYISKVSNSAIATTTSSGPTASSTVSSVVASGSTTGDTANAYIVNTSRTFTYNFSMLNNGGAATAKKLSITQINYGTGEAAGTGAGQNAEFTVNFGLENLYVQVP